MEEFYCENMYIKLLAQSVSVNANEQVFFITTSQAVLLCLLDLFPILEKALQWKGGAARPTTHCDEVLQLILTHMEPEHRLLLRRTYARTLPAFVKR